MAEAERLFMSWTLVTGADGYLGKRISNSLLESGNRLLICVRAETEEEKDKKREALADLIGESARLHFVNLSKSGAFSEIKPEEVEGIIHTAAVIRFNVEEDLADQVNIQGARQVFEFARSCPQLKKLSYVSSIYASGLAEGVVEEGPLDGAAGFANHYERSKWEAEQLLIQEFSDLPWVIARVATVIADDDSGQVSQFNAVHNTLKLMFYGLLSLVPGDRETPLYFVTGDFAVRSILKAHLEASPQNFYHICHSYEEAIKLEEMIDLAYETFMEDADFKSRRLLKPLFVSYEAFEKMSQAVQGFGSQITSQALDTVTPFAEELFKYKNVKTRRLESLIRAEEKMSDQREIFRNLCHQLIRTKWGRNHVE